MTIEVRLATAADTDGVLAIDPRTKVDVGRMDWLRKALAGHRGRMVRVALVQDEIVGFAVMGEFFGHPFLELIGAAQDRLRQGVASALMAEIEQAFQGDRMFVSTNESNTVMRTLLAARDYKVSGIVENLDAGDPELFFVKFRRTPT